MQIIINKQCEKNMFPVKSTRLLNILFNTILWMVFRCVKKTIVEKWILMRKNMKIFVVVVIYELSITCTYFISYLCPLSTYYNYSLSMESIDLHNALFLVYLHEILFWNWSKRAKISFKKPFTFPLVLCDVVLYRHWYKYLLRGWTIEMFE